MSRPNHGQRNLVGYSPGGHKESDMTEQLSTAQHNPFLTNLVCPRVRFSRVWLCVTLWTRARQSPLSMGFFRQEYWSGLPCPLPGDPPNPGVKPKSLIFPALEGRLFTSSSTWEAPDHFTLWQLLLISQIYIHYSSLVQKTEKVWDKSENFKRGHKLYQMLIMIKDVFHLLLGKCINEYYLSTFLIWTKRKHQLLMIQIHKTFVSFI